MVYTGRVKYHNVCKSHNAIDTGVKQSEHTNFFDGIKFVTACIFEENNISKNSHTIQNPDPACKFGFLHHNKVKNVGQICCWSGISFSLVTHRDVTLSPA